MHFGLKWVVLGLKFHPQFFATFYLCFNAIFWRIYSGICFCNRNRCIFSLEQLNAILLDWNSAGLCKLCSFFQKAFWQVGSGKSEPSTILQYYNFLKAVALLYWFSLFCPRNLNGCREEASNLVPILRYIREKKCTFFAIRTICCIYKAGSVVLLPQLPRSLTGHFHWSSNLPLPWLRQSWLNCPWPPIAKLLTDQSFRWFVGFFPADKVHIALALIGHSGLNKNILPSPKCPYVANFNAFFLWGLFNFTIRIPLLQFSIVNPFSWKLEDIFPLLSVALRLGVSKAKDKITSTRINLKLLDCIRVRPAREAQFISLAVAASKALRRPLLYMRSIATAFLRNHCP